MSGKFHEVGVVTDHRCCGDTDVCCADAMPEVELVSLVGETLPRYKLRADTMTEFAGYSHSDWSQCTTVAGGPTSPAAHPGLEPGEGEEEEFTDAQIENLLDYFILCGLRVNQMTKTYNDVEAVTQLLEEKERDLELAATIGKKLLEKNKKLEETVELLEEQLRTSSDEVRQLRHELSLKDDLLRMYVEDAEEAGEAGESSVSSGASFSLSRVDVDSLQRKVRALQEENVELRTEQHTMACSAQRFEEKEQALMRDCLGQLTEANQHIRTLSEELSRKTDKCMQQQEDVTYLLARNVDLEARVKQLAAENEAAAARCRESEAGREAMTAHLGELRDRYDECLALLSEAQSESRDLRRRHRRHRMPDGDLASELALASRRSSVLLEVESDPEDAHTEASGSVRVMDAVRRLRRPPASLESNQDTSAAARSDLYSCSSLSASSLSHATWDVESRLPPLPSPPPPRVDPASRAAAMVTAARQRPHAAIPGSASFSSPPQPREPAELSNASYLSTGSNAAGAGREMVQSWLSNAPEKLQIVKPIEGSLTLRQWQHLATPSLSRALFESPPAGIHVRGGKNRQGNHEEEEDTAYSDVEEDDAVCLSKPAEAHQASTRMTADSGHPTTPPTFTSDSHVTSPYSSSSSCFSNPEHSARMARHNISSLSPGLARLLCERGIHSQAAVAALSSSESSGEESEAVPMPPLYHAQLLESINRVGHRLWHALSGDGAVGAPPGLSPQTSSSSGGTVRGDTPGGLNCCLSPTATPTASGAAAERGAPVLRRTDR